MTAITPSRIGARRALPAGARTELLGLMLIATTLTVVLAVGVASGTFGDELGFFIAVLAIAWVASALVWRFGTWAKAVGIVASIALGLALFWTAFGLAYPSSVLDFVPGIAVPAGVLLGVGGGITALVKRQELSEEAGAGERRLARIVLGIVGVALVISAVAAFVGRTVIPDAEAAGGVPVTMKAFEFTEGTYTAGSGGSVTVHNADAWVHTFTVPALGIDETVNPGSKVQIALGDAAPGTYTVYCEPHSNLSEADPADAGMAASLVIE